jgi:hypothetical protein
MDENLKQFVSQVVGLDPTPPGTKASYGGLIGASNPRQQTVEELKRKTLQYAAERRRQTPNKNIANQLAKDIEGNFYSLHALSVIDDHSLNQYVDKLNSIHSKPL